ncbi:MAG: hypothetical protein IKX37_06215, partial [Bacteroidales bacterium]|nr:hypothetical protein [Bacteroidales bacterium]
MKRTLIFFFLAAAAIIASGCKDNNQPEEPAAGKITLTSQAPVVLSEEGGSAQIAFNATKEWTATSAE